MMPPPEPLRRELLLLDDDDVLRAVLGRALAARGFEVRGAGTLDECERLLGDGWQPGFAILDLNLGGASGLRAIALLRATASACRILVLTGYASIATAVDAIKLGAHQYLSKPVEADRIVRTLLEDAAPDADAAPCAALSVPRLEWEHIQRVLADHGGNIAATARALRMHRRTLQRKLGKRPARD
jgi:two-component system response regulator RegA